MKNISNRNPKQVFSFFVVLLYFTEKTCFTTECKKGEISLRKDEEFQLKKYFCSFYLFLLLEN